MKWQALLLSTLGFGLLAAAGPDPDACGDPAMPPPVEKISCGTWLEDLGCKWDSDYISCIQTCRRQKGMNRLIYHNHRYYDISVAEYDRIMNAEKKKQSARAEEFTVTATTTKTVAAIKATKKAGVHHTSKKTVVHHTSKKTAFETVFRTITHVARQPAVETGLVAIQTTDNKGCWTFRCHQCG